MIEQLLDQLSEYEAQRSLIMLDKQALIDAVLTAEIKAKLADIEAEFAEKVDTVSAKANELTAAIKDAVINSGATVKGSHLMAVYVKGRTSWDSKTLDGLALVIPSLLKARKEGDPSVSIRKI